VFIIIERGIKEKRRTKTFGRIEEVGIRKTIKIT